MWQTMMTNDVKLSNARIAGRYPVFRNVAFLSLSVIAALLSCAATSVPNDDTMLFVCALIAWIVLLGWLTLTFFLAPRRVRSGLRTPIRSRITAFAIALIIVALALSFALPLRVRLWQSEAQLRRVANESEQGVYVGPTHSGSFDVLAVRNVTGGVLIETGGAAWLSIAGFAYFPNGAPKSPLLNTVYIGKHLFGPWYVWTSDESLDIS
jgi:hypothetical protein